jgi:hypothetical protein
MGRYVLLLIAPLVIGVVIAAGVVIFTELRERTVLNALRQRRIEARRTSVEDRTQHRLSAADPDSEQPPDAERERIAS